MRGNQALIRCVCVVVLVALGGMPARAACRLSGEQLGSATQESLRRQPTTLLLQYPNGEEGLRGVTLQMAAAGSQTLDAVVSVVGAANNAQRQMIGAGLAAAVNTCSRQDSDLAKRIRDAAKGSGSSALQRSFNMAIDTSALEGVSLAPATPAAMPSAGLTPGIGGDLTIPKPSALAGPADPFGDPAAWH